MPNKRRIVDDEPPARLRRLLEDFLKDASTLRIRLTVLAGMRSQLHWLVGDREIELDACVRGAMNEASEHLGSLPDQKDVEKHCRILFKALAHKFGGGASFKLGRKGQKSRLVMNAYLAQIAHEALNDDRFSLPDEEGSAPKRREAALQESRTVSSEDVLAALQPRGDDLRRFHVADLRLVGSVARDENRADSDVDFLVTFDRVTNGEDYFGLKFFLEDLLKRDVDLITRTSVGSRWLERLERDAIHVA